MVLTIEGTMFNDFRQRINPYAYRVVEDRINGIYTYYFTDEQEFELRLSGSGMLTRCKNFEPLHNQRVAEEVDILTINPNGRFDIEVGEHCGSIQIEKGHYGDNT